MLGLLTLEEVASVLLIAVLAVLGLDLPFIQVADGPPLVHRDDLAEFVDALRHDARTRSAARNEVAELADTRTHSGPLLQRAG